MARHSTRKSATVLMIVESLLNLIALPLGLVTAGMALIPISEFMDSQTVAQADMAELQTLYHPELAGIFTFLFLLLFAAARVVQGFRFREKKGKGFLRLSLVQAGVILAAGVLPMIIGYDLITTTLVSVLIGCALIAGRVFYMIHHRKASSIIFSIISILIIAVCAISFINMTVLLFMLTVSSLLSIVFSRISFSVLKKIIVKTHAAEIIFGLVLLIVTFAMLLTFFEPNMGKFTDALWYCFAIVTTIGFGDLTAVTDFGRILSVILGVYGIVVVALITSIIVNFYGEMKTSPDSESEGTEETKQDME